MSGLDLHLDHILAHKRNLSVNDSVGNCLALPRVREVGAGKRHVALSPSANARLLFLAQRFLYCRGRAEDERSRQDFGLHRHGGVGSDDTAAANLQRRQIRSLPCQQALRTPISQACTMALCP